MKTKLYLLSVCALMQGITFAQAPKISYQTPQAYAVGVTIAPLKANNSGGTITYGAVSTFAGNDSGNAGSLDNIIGSLARFNYPSGVATDAQGNVFVADAGNNKIRKISPAGTVSTLAGNGTQGSADGNGSSASFYSPYGVAVDAQGNVYVADRGNNKIRMISPAGMVTTLAGNGTQGSADGSGPSASFNYPWGIAVDAQGNVYVADYSNFKIRKISPAGTVSTLAGSGTQGSADGTGSSASFNYPAGVAIDSQGNVYVADSNNNKIRMISPAGMVSTLATGFYEPEGVAVDIQGYVYVANTEGHTIRKISPAGTVSILAGDVHASFNYPASVAVDSQGNVYVADSYSNKIEKVWAGGYTISPQLPAGLNFDFATGTISGTPTVVSPQTTYTVTAINGYGTDTTSVVITVVSVLGVEDVAFKDMVLYPNPTTGEVNINNVFVEKVNVYNTLGQLVKTITNQVVNTTSVQLNNLPTGIYYLHIETENAHTVKQVIKQ